MHRVAPNALPHSLIQACAASRPGNASAFRTGLGRVCLTDLKTQATARHRFIRQHLLEARPAGIEHALCHLGLGQFRRADVANDDEPVSLRNLRALLMQVILTPIGDLGVDIADPLWRLSAALRHGQLSLALAVELRNADPAAVRKRRQHLQAEVDADPLIGCLAGTLQLDWKVDVPSAASVLVEASGSNPDTGRKNIAQVHRLVSDAMETERLTVERDVARVERHPAERVAVTEAEPPLLLLLAGFYILLAHPLNRVGMQMEFDAGTCRKPRQVPGKSTTCLSKPTAFRRRAAVPRCSHS